jgi:hypothetical protein
MKKGTKQVARIVAASTALFMMMVSTRPSTLAFVPPMSQVSVPISENTVLKPTQRTQLQMFPYHTENDFPHTLKEATKILTSASIAAALSISLFLGASLPAFAENELSDIYGNKGFDTSLVDQKCLVDRCSLQAKTCLADDPDCRKGLICTAKCLGDNSCITGCMARYGDSNLDDLLKCTIEDHQCIKVAILEGGQDKYGEEPRPPAPTIRNFNLHSMEGQWYKVVGFNPNYDCYACQKNTFTAPNGGSGIFSSSGNKLEVDVQFSMPRMMPDGTPPPPTLQRESINVRADDGLMFGSQSIGFNDYETHEVMVFDNVQDSKTQAMNLVLRKGTDSETSYHRTAHSEGEMFGLKFWENWYVIGENDPGQQEFKFIYYNGKTRQNTYDGAFVYSRTKELGPEAMTKVYKIASEAGMNPDQFCKIRNGCFKDETAETGLGSPSNPFRGILASTKVSQLLGVEPVAAEGVLKNTQSATAKLGELYDASTQRKWWHELGDYLEDPNRHFKAMDSLRVVMDWPENVKR